MSEATFHVYMDWFDPEIDQLSEDGELDAVPSQSREDLDPLSPTQPYSRPADTVTDVDQHVDLPDVGPNFNDIDIIIQEAAGQVIPQVDQEDWEDFLEASVEDGAGNDPDWEDGDVDVDLVLVVEQAQAQAQIAVSNSSTRFQTYTTMQLESFRNEQRNKDTSRKTKNHIKILHDFLRSKDCQDDIGDMQPQHLDQLLGEFMISVRKEKPDKDGSLEYEPSTLRGMLGSFERHLKELHYGHSLISSPIFHYTREMLKSKSKELKKQGKGNKGNKSSGMTNQEIDQLWSTGALGATSPRSLVHTIWWNSTFWHAGCEREL